MATMDSRASTLEKGGSAYFEHILSNIMLKLQNDPASITTEDARRLSENVVVDDEQTAKVVSAVESFAAASEIMNESNPHLGQPPHTSLLTVVNDLKVAVEQNPGDVTTEILKTTQNIVSKMQKAIGHTNAPHPELEEELREEIAKIEPKVAEGTVTIEEANHLHSLEARAHGHTERGGITSLAQSVAAKRERQLSLSSGSSPTTNRSRANSKTFGTHELYRRDAAPSPKARTGAASPSASDKYHESISDHTNVSGRASVDDHDVNTKLSEMSLDSQVKKGVSAEDRFDSGNTEGKVSLHKRENSQPIVEVK